MGAPRRVQCSLRCLRFQHMKMGARREAAGVCSMCYVCAHRLIIQASALLTVNICMGELWRINAVRGGYSGSSHPAPLALSPGK